MNTSRTRKFNSCHPGCQNYCPNASALKASQPFPNNFVNATVFITERPTESPPVLNMMKHSRMHLQSVCVSIFRCGWLSTTIQRIHPFKQTNAHKINDASCDLHLGDARRINGGLCNALTIGVCFEHPDHIPSSCCAHHVDAGLATLTCGAVSMESATVAAPGVKIIVQ